jgi:hypothetical protein
MKADKRKKKRKEKRKRVHAVRIRRLREHSKMRPLLGSTTDSLLEAFLESHADEVFETLSQSPNGEGLISVHARGLREIQARIRLDDVLKRQKGITRPDGPFKFIFQ